MCITLFWSWTLFEILHCVSHRPLPILAWLQYHPQNDSWISLEKEYVYNLFIIVPKTEGFPQTQIASAHKYLPQPLPWWRWSEGSVERLCQSFGRRPVNDHDDKSNALIRLKSLQQEILSDCDQSYLHFGGCQCSKLFKVNFPFKSKRCLWNYWYFCHITERW